MKNIDYEIIKTWRETKVVPEGYTEPELTQALIRWLDYFDYCIWEPLSKLDEESLRQHKIIFPDFTIKENK